MAAPAFAPTPARPPARAFPRRRRGTVLIVVMITILLAAFALVAFVDRASRDLLIETRQADARRLRREAHAALETVIAVLATFREVNGQLRSPAEGWSNPLEWAGYELPEGMRAEIQFDDESGKLSLPRAEPTQLKLLFESFGLLSDDAQLLTDALLGWTREDYVATSSGAPDAYTYERGEIPYKPAGRNLRSFGELRAIEGIRQRFFDEAGQPTELYHRFTGAVSLLRFDKPNINASPDALLDALGQYDSYQRQQLADFRAGTGTWRGRGAGWINNPSELATILGGQARVDDFGIDIRALRVRVTIIQGQARYTLSALIAPPRGARWPSNSLNANAQGEAGEEGAGGGANASATAAGAAQTAAANSPETKRLEAARLAATRRNEEKDDAGRTPADKTLKYPFTLLEITENDDTTLPPAPSDGVPPSV